jgi:hypothetical protein
MKKQIVKLLLEHNQNYEVLFDYFPYKNDPVAVFEHEQQYYIKPLSATIIPLLAKQAHDDNGNQDDTLYYLDFINKKYHELILKEVYEFKVNTRDYHLETAKKLEKEFMLGLLENNNKSEEVQNKFINEFLQKNHDFFIEMSMNTPDLFLKTVSQLRNPKAQYAILNKDRILTYNIKMYLVSLDKENLDITLKNYFTYPLEIDVKMYYDKWIGKDKIHIKFSSGIFDEKYKYAKKCLKMLVKDMVPTLDEFNQQSIESKEVDIIKNNGSNQQQH